MTIPIAVVLPSKDMTVNTKALPCSRDSGTPRARHRPVNLDFIDYLLSNIPGTLV